MTDDQQSAGAPGHPAIDPADAGFATVAEDQSAEGVLQRLVELSARVLPGAPDVSVTLIRAGEAVTGAATTERALALDHVQYSNHEGPCFDAASAGSVARVEDLTTEERWPAFVAAALAAGFACSLAIPLPLVREVTGALNVFFTEKGAATDEAVEMAETLAAYAAVAVANVQRYESAVALADQMREAMTSRAVIEQAKGIVMAEQRCSADEAFDLLVKLSQESHLKLRAIAERLVASVSPPSAT
jgi:GAF domain-containing protein